LKQAVETGTSAAAAGEIGIDISAHRSKSIDEFAGRQ
jgi:protein-tyrosine-phosphatase